MKTFYEVVEKVIDPHFEAQRGCGLTETEMYWLEQVWDSPEGVDTDPWDAARESELARKWEKQLQEESGFGLSNTHFQMIAMVKSWRTLTL